MASFKDIFDDGVSWQKGKDRQDVVIAYLAKHAPLVEVTVIGNGADSVQRVETYSDESGFPDLLLSDRLTGDVLSFLEVTGTDREHRVIWVGAHKIAWAEEHPESAWFAAVVFGESRKPIFVWAREGCEQNLAWVKTQRRRRELMVLFGPGDPGILAAETFIEWLLARQRALWAAAGIST